MAKIHIVDGSKNKQTMCGVNGPDVPEGERFVYFPEADKANCEVCIEQYRLMLAAGPVSNLEDRMEAQYGAQRQCAQPGCTTYFRSKVESPDYAYCPGHRPGNTHIIHSMLDSNTLCGSSMIGTYWKMVGELSGTSTYYLCPTCYKKMQDEDGDTQRPPAPEERPRRHDGMLRSILSTVFEHAMMEKQRMEERQAELNDFWKCTYLETLEYTRTITQDIRRNCELAREYANIAAEHFNQRLDGLKPLSPSVNTNVDSAGPFFEDMEKIIPYSHDATVDDQRHFHFDVMCTCGERNQGVLSVPADGNHTDVTATQVQCPKCRLINMVAYDWTKKKVVQVKWVKPKLKVEVEVSVPTNDKTPAFEVLLSTDGVPVKVHPEFAASYRNAPTLWQYAVDDAAKRMPADDVDADSGKTYILTKEGDKEYFCDECGNLRLWIAGMRVPVQENPTACQNCGNEKIYIDVVNSGKLNKMRELWNVRNEKEFAKNAF